MKKSFLYLFTVLCTLSFFTACSDDDDPKDPNVLDVNTAYSGDKLDLKYSDSPLLGKEITFETKDGKTATITMKGIFDMSTISGLFSGGSKADLVPSFAPGVIPGEVTTTLSNVVLIQVGEKYTFEGTDEANGRTVKYVGEVQKDKMTLALDVTMPANPLQEVGLWKLNGSTFKWVSSVDIELDLFNEPYPMKDASALLNTIIIQPKLKEVLVDVTFKADGNIIATYKKEKVGEPQTSPINLANYYIKNNKLYVTLNIDMIIQAATKADDSKELVALITALMKTPLMSALSEGFPLNYTIKDGVANVSIDEEFLLPILKVVINSPFVIEKINGLVSDNQNLAKMLEAVLKQMPAIVDGTSELSFGLNLEK